MQSLLCFLQFRLQSKLCRESPFLKELRNLILLWTLVPKLYSHKTWLSSCTLTNLALKLYSHKSPFLFTLEKKKNSLYILLIFSHLFWLNVLGRFLRCPSRNQFMIFKNAFLKSGQNLWKIHIQEFIFSTFWSCRSSALVKMNFFADLFQGFFQKL